jgi:hypothetical protein
MGDGRCEEGAYGVHQLTCPRCGEVCRAPGWWSDSWTCTAHGAIAPVHPAIGSSAEATRQLAQRSQVPLWLPWPLPVGWVVSGLQHAGDEHTGPVAAVLAASGPNPFPQSAGTLRISSGGPEPDRLADLLLVAEQPGVGLGARLAGLRDVDPGERIVDRLTHTAAHLKLSAKGHEVPLWAVPVPDGAAYVGEAAGVWLWALLWPEQAAAVLLEPFELVDLRDPGHRLEVPYGALSRRLV